MSIHSLHFFSEHALAPYPAPLCPLAWTPCKTLLGFCLHRIGRRITKSSILIFSYRFIVAVWPYIAFPDGSLTHHTDRQSVILLPNIQMLDSSSRYLAQVCSPSQNHTILEMIRCTTAMLPMPQKYLNLESKLKTKN